MNLSKISFEAIKKECVLRDDQIPGLYLRVGKRSKTWNYYRFGQPRACLGQYPTHSLEDAREWARELNGGKRTRWPLKDVVERLTTRAERKGNRRPDYVRRQIALHAPSWLAKELEAITKPMVSDRYDELCRDSGPSAAHHFVTAVKVLFNFAIKNLDWGGRNPAVGLDMEELKPRQTVWTDEQLAAFFVAAREEDPSLYWHDYFLIVARTGARRGNVAAMEWKEIKGDTWTIPASKFKTGVDHSIPLVPDVLAALERRKNKTQWVWPSITGVGPLGYPFPAFQRICARAGIAGVTIHDLRRTLGSRLAAKVPLQVVAKVLGHKTINTTLRSYAVIADSVARDALMNL